MKALISPNENFNIVWVSSWTQQDSEWIPNTSTIYGCQRVAQVEQDENVFAVAAPLFWVNCPNNCTADYWYYKDGQCYEKPSDVPHP